MCMREAPLDNRGKTNENGDAIGARGRGGKVKFPRAIGDWRLLVCLVFVGAVSGGIAYAASPE